MREKVWGRQTELREPDFLFHGSEGRKKMRQKIKGAKQNGTKTRGGNKMG